MATTLADISTRVLTRLAADMAVPAYSKIDSATITTFANSFTNKIVWHFINLFQKSQDPKALAPIQGLQKLSAAVTLAVGTGIGTLPADAEFVTSVLVLPTVNTVRRAKLYYHADDFERWDSSNFVLTPSSKMIVALISNDTIRVRPLATATPTFATAYIDYIKTHPTMSAGQGTEFSAGADTILVALILSKIYDFLEEPELSKMALLEAGIGA